MMSGNKGEWSELYAFFKLLSQGRVHAANEKVEKIDTVYYPITKIMREEQQGTVIDYIISEDKVLIEIQSNQIMSVLRKDLEEVANNLLNEISIHNGSFEIEEVAKFANGIKVTKIKAPSRNTTDISLEIQDPYTNFIRPVGFSIKSEVHNLIMIDSSMPQIIANILLYYYEEEIKECTSLIKLIGERDPLGYGDAMMYEYKFKKFLCSCALGMKPGKVWNGLDEANGGYIIVKSDGEILVYHIYNRNFFEQYLIDNTVMERASTSRHDYISLYKENDELFIKLNLQIRFK
ncbi:MAG: HpaII family restriction endonuclease [Clostridiales bacterium]|nr:HpaII family restriction endonuclease [Clostridiales bacterium]